MTVHLIKLAVGAKDPGDVAAFQQRLLAHTGRVFHRTRQMPKRAADITDGGSLYWVVAGIISLRQRILAIEEAVRDDGAKAADLVLDPTLITVRPRAARAFQGWRYLAANDAPEDADAKTTAATGALPPDMRRELARLGLL